jgi:hypothetical protein
MITVTDRALPKLRELQLEGKQGQVFRVLFKGFG